MGDFNFGDYEDLENSRIPDVWKDPWKILRPGERGYTWNIQKSVFAKQNSFKDENSRRLDRILVHSDYWHPAEVRILGDEPYIPGTRDRFPSDHFGLVTVLTCAAAEAK